MKSGKIIVSENTARFIECLKKYQELVTDISDAIEAVYGEVYTDKIMMKGQFYELRNSFQDTLYSFMNCSIMDNLSFIDSNEI